MNPRTTGILLLVALALFAFVWLYELGGEDARLEAEESGKRLFADLAAEDVEWIELQSSDGIPVRAERRDEAWWLVEPVEFPADDSVGRMAETLAAIGHEAVFDKPQPDAEYGLDDASARIVRFGAGAGSRELRLGDETPLGSDVYARTGDAAPVYTVASYRKSVFARSLDDLREKQILDFDPITVRGLEASWPGGRVVLEREPTDEEGEQADWRLVAPLDARADSEAVDRLLSTLSFLRAEGFSDEPGAERLALLEPPDFTLTLEREGAEPLGLRISRPDAGERRWVQGEGGVLYEIGADRLDDFPREAGAYRYRLLSSFPLSEARQVDLLFAVDGGDPVVLHAEHGEAGWSSGPESFAAGKLPRLVSELSRLEAEAILAESMGEDELTGLGLSPPNAILTVLGQAAGDADEGDPLPVLAEVHLGRVTPEGVVARSAGDPVVYRLPLALTEDVPVSLAEFRDRFRAEEEAEVEPPLGLDPVGELPDPTEESP